MADPDLKYEVKKHSPMYYELLHAVIKADTPAGVVLGPFMFTARWYWFSGAFTRLALFLLRRAGWQLVTSKFERISDD